MSPCQVMAVVPLRLRAGGLLPDPQDDNEPPPYSRRGDDPGDDALAGHYDDE